MSSPDDPKVLQWKRRQIEALVIELAYEVTYIDPPIATREGLHECSVKDISDRLVRHHFIGTVGECLAFLQGRSVGRPNEVTTSNIN
jgi:hypothetical protein